MEIVRLGNQSVDALIDTGAARSLMSNELARELKLHVIPQTQYCKPLLSATWVAGKIQYCVKYTDGKVYNCDWVNRPLLDHHKAKGHSQQSPQTQTWSNRRNRNVHCY